MARRQSGSELDQHPTISVTTPPWQREWVQVDPTQFELIVVEFIREAGVRLEGFRVEHQGIASGPEGEFAMDAIARFGALGADFTVLIECKHHRAPLERDAVLVLAEKVAIARAQKGMLFATGGFQSGAVAYAQHRHVALVHVTEGGPIYEVRSRQPPTNIPRRPFDVYLVTPTASGTISYSAPGAEKVRETLHRPAETV